MIYKNICSVINPDSQEAITLCDQIESKFSNVSWQKVNDFKFDMVQNIDLVIAIGGDGTLLRAVSLAVKYDVPVLGINMGTVGFMTDIEGDKALSELEEYLNGVRIEERSMLEIEFNNSGNKNSYIALNDIVIARGSSISMIETITEIDNVHLATYRGDGIVISTATGSTGYALALGGPVLDPKSSDYFIKPVSYTHLRAHET